MFNSGSARRTSQMSVSRRPVPDAALDHQATQPRGRLRIHAVPVLDLLAVFLREGQQIIGLAEACGNDIVQATNPLGSPSGSRESDGATTLNDSKSAGVRARLSVTRKLPYQRRK